MKLFCNTCRQHTKHKVVQSYSQTYRLEDNPGMSVDYANGTWEIIQCAGCELVSFQESWLTSEDWVPDQGPVPTVYRYPKAEEDQLAVKYFFEAPAYIYRIYRETIQSFNIESYILCAAGLRAVIEGICEKENVKSGLVEKKIGGKTFPKKEENLEGKIEGLHQKGILSKKHAEILHALRFIGNEAVHKLNTPPRDDLKEAIEIVEHTIENLYVLSERGHRLLAKKQKN